MPSHKLNTYLDGRAEIEYCTVCGAEGEELVEPCSGRYVVTRTKKKVDKDKQAS